jgi:hypothetical protein
MKPGDLVLITWLGWTKIGGKPELREYTAIYLDGHASRSECCVFVCGRMRYVSTRDLEVINEAG